MLVDAAGVRVSLHTGDVLSGNRMLLAGLGPLRSATGAGDRAVLLVTVSGERWLVRMSPFSGLVAAVEPAAVMRPVAVGADQCATVM